MNTKQAQCIMDLPDDKCPKDDLLEIHLEMSKVIGRIKEIQEDRKWEVYELALPETTMVRR